MYCYLFLEFTSVSLSISTRHNISTRVTKVGIPLADEEEDNSPSDNDEEEGPQACPKQDEQTSPQPVTTSDASEGCGLLSSLKYYEFELKEPSEEDRRIYER